MADIICPRCKRKIGSYEIECPFCELPLQTYLQDSGIDDFTDIKYCQGLVNSEIGLYEQYYICNNCFNTFDSPR